MHVNDTHLSLSLQSVSTANIYSKQAIQSILIHTVILKCRCEFCDEEISWLQNGIILNKTVVLHTELVT